MRVSLGNQQTSVRFQGKLHYTTAVSHREMRTRHRKQLRLYFPVWQTGGVCDDSHAKKKNSPRNYESITPSVGWYWRPGLTAVVTRWRCGHHALLVSKCSRGLKLILIITVYNQRLKHIYQTTAELRLSFFFRQEYFSHSNHNDSVLTGPTHSENTHAH